MALMTDVAAGGPKNGSRPNWAPIMGEWTFDAETQRFLGKGALEASTYGQKFPMGLAASSATLQDGSCAVKIRFSGPFNESEQAAGVVLGYRTPDQHYVFAQLGAARSAYSIGEHADRFAWRPLATQGQRENLVSGLDYSLRVGIQGQELKVFVNDVQVLEELLPRPLEGRQVGLIAAGNHEIIFSDLTVRGSRPRAFVVMQFAEPYDTFYREVIEKQADAAGFDVIRIDEKAGPGVIFQDMQREIEQAGVVIAEITPPNPNVFYEVGYAHALGKPTILLAQRGAQLPFDIRSFRVVFYNDSIGGKAEVDRNLKMHLEAIAGR